MIESVLKVLSTIADQKLPGWSIDEMKYWRSDAGVEYMEVRIAVIEEVLWLRLKVHESSIRVAGVKLYTKRELSRGRGPNGKGEGS